MRIVKLGGSVITNKTRYRSLRGRDLARLARELARAGRRDLAVVHGAGSFGHVLAKRYNLVAGYRHPRQLLGFVRVQRDVRALNLAVLDALARAKIPAVALPPSVIARFDDGTLASFDGDPFDHFLRIGFTPVSFGDAVLDARRGFTICSGDDVMLELARRFRPERVVFAADVDGVYTADPKRVRSAKLLGEISAETVSSIDLSARAAADVTGSLEAKILKMAQIARHADDVRIVNGLKPGRVARALRGDSVPGTRVVP